jgi:autotransporter translocation and assembly factor TamB
MRAARRLLQIVALLGTLLVGAVSAALIVSQTPWFKDWVRRYIVRESKQYLNGELTIGHLGGNLFFATELADVAVDISGERVVAVKALEVDYSVFTLISKGIVLDRIRLVEPALRLERAAQGWNLGRLVKQQQREAEREGPGRSVTLRSIEISDGTLDIVQNGGENGEPGAYHLPGRIEELDVRAAFEYAPVHYSIDIDQVSFRGRSPELILRELSGKVAVRDDTLYLDNVRLHTADSAVTVDGVVEQYLDTPIVKLTTTGNLSMPEIGRILPAASGYPLSPVFDVKASGPTDALVLDLDVRSEAGTVRGVLTTDVRSPGFGAEGDVRVERLDLAPLLRNPEQRSEITGRAKVDLTVAPEPADAPFFERMSGTFRFDGPRVVAAGYTTGDVRATGKLGNGRIDLDARATAYGGTATATGFVAPASRRRPLAFDLRGSAENVNLKGLPASTRAPALETNLSLAEYQVGGTGQTISGTARLNESEIEGATIAEGTVAEFSTSNGRVTYAARGGIEDLDLQRLGGALKVSALNQSRYASRIAGTFDVRGSGTGMESLTIDASGSLSDAELMGARLRGFAFETTITGSALDGRVKGGFERLDPARVASKQRFEGVVNGTVDAAFRLASFTEPITPEAISASGRIDVEQSRVGGLEIDAASIQGEYANSIGDFARVHVEGPDLLLDATGRLALDRATDSNLEYHLEATDLAGLGRLAGQEGIDGSAILDGRLTGNAASMQTTGTLDGSNLAYQGNTALDLNAKYDVTVPELSFGDAIVRATTIATFVKTGGLQLNSVEATATYVRKTLDFTALLKDQAREVDAQGRVVFHPDHQEIHLPSFAIRTQGQEWRSRMGSEAAVQYGAGRLAFQNVQLVSGGQSLNVEGTLAVGEEQPSGTLGVEAGNVDVAQLEQLLLQDWGFSGQLDARATITGTARQPIVDGRIEIANGGFRGYRYELLTADLDYKGNRLDLDARLQQSPTEAITAAGTVPMSLFARSESAHVAPTDGERVDLRIRSTDIGLGLVQGFTTAVTNITGTMQADVRVIGSGEDPHLEGYIDIRNGAFGVPLGGVSYSGLHTRIELTPDLVRIPKFQLTDEHGEPLTISGQLAVHARQVGAVDITLQSDNFEVIDNALGDVGVDTQLTITGELRRPRVQGQVRLEAARIEVDRVLQLFQNPYAVSALPPVESAERSVEGAGSAQQAARQALARAEGAAAPPAAEKTEPGGEAQPAGVFAPVEIDVRLVIPDNLVLRGNNLRPRGPTRAAIGNMNVTVGGDLQVRKQPGGPITLTGVIQTVRGTYEFQDRRFDLVRGGTLRFSGDPTINPMLNVAATRMIPDTGVEARIDVTGTARAPELRLSSTPPLDESDVLSLVVFNRPVNELGTGERASLAATAGGIATGFIAAPLGESIGRALDVDLFEITTTTDTGELGAGITVGQQIGDRAFFRLRQQFGERNVSEFLIEYQLADFLRLRGSAAPEAVGSANRVNQRRVERAGIDLIFVFSY